MARVCVCVCGWQLRDRSNMKLQIVVVVVVCLLPRSRSHAHAHPAPLTESEAHASLSPLIVALRPVIVFDHGTGWPRSRSSLPLLLPPRSSCRVLTLTPTHTATRTRTPRRPPLRLSWSLALMAIIKPSNLTTQSSALRSNGQHRRPTTFGCPTDAQPRTSRPLHLLRLPRALS